jgi:hypothetical protein
MHHLTQIVGLIVNAISAAVPTATVHDNDATAIDDVGDNIGVYATSSFTTVEGEQRFMPTYGSELASIIVVARPALSSLNSRADALELVGKAQDAIYASQALERITTSIERTELAVESEVRSENQSSFAAQTFAVKYYTQDANYQKIVTN